MAIVRLNKRHVMLCYVNVMLCLFQRVLLLMLKTNTFDTARLRCPLYCLFHSVNRFVGLQEGMCHVRVLFFTSSSHRSRN